jgi:Phytanoyl-CoA dioxygenase (PhyH)
MTSRRRSARAGHHAFVIDDAALDGAADADFRARGFVVMRAAFDPGPLSDEVDRTLADGLCASATDNTGSGGIEFRYLPMMCERTPVSVSLIDALARSAAALLGRAVLPVRAKGTRYFGGSEAHRDNALDVASVGFLAYLEPLTASSGALRVRPGSHVAPSTGAHLELTEAVETEPGDVIVFDEHLWHGSVGGNDRRQWRVDFVVDPVDAAETARVREYFARIFPPDWDGRYDVDRYPSYGADWRSGNRPWVERLRELGAYELADTQEHASRRSRGSG